MAEGRMYPWSPGGLWTRCKRRVIPSREERNLIRRSAANHFTRLRGAVTGEAVPSSLRSVRDAGEGGRLREQLIEAASRLLAAPVVEEPLSLRAVACEVGVVPPSVYLHFSDKTQLVQAVIERRFDELGRHAGC
jgi:hypothetical protein